MYYNVKNTEQFWHGLNSFSTGIEESIPTLDRMLDSWFEEHFPDIIEEWDLLTEGDLRHASQKIDFLSYEVNRLMIERSSVDHRIQNLKASIEDLERII